MPDVVVGRTSISCIIQKYSSVWAHIHNDSNVTNVPAGLALGEETFKR